MKVTTDACLLGAYAAMKIISSSLKIETCLDIGAGTGLLSLMLAQKINGHFDAVEIDQASYLQAKENIDTSVLTEKISVFHADILQFNQPKKYDCIICNPPFYENDLKSIDDNKNKAKHNTSLSLKQLITSINNCLSDKGYFFVLLPYHRMAYFEKEVALLKFHLAEKISVRQTAAHDFFRCILFFSRKECLQSEKEIIIKNEHGNYTEEFISLLKDYYLNL